MPSDLIKESYCKKRGELGIRVQGDDPYQVQARNDRFDLLSCSTDTCPVSRLHRERIALLTTPLFIMQSISSVLCRCVFYSWKILVLTRTQPQNSVKFQHLQRYALIRNHGQGFIKRCSKSIFEVVLVTQALSLDKHVANLQTKYSRKAFMQLQQRPPQRMLRLALLKLMLCSRSHSLAPSGQS